jgi:SAM-dependent methyltransferase
MALKAWVNQVIPGRGTYLDTIRHWNGYTHADFTASALKGKYAVLVVGDAGGRDSHYLSALGHDVSQLDLSQQDAVPDLVVQSIEDRTPFADGRFDGVVLNEVLEHLHRDIDALREVRRILKPDGVLVASVPMSQRQDRADFHLRIHTPRTFDRLLAAAGFTVTDRYYRGVIARLAQTRPGQGITVLGQIILSRAGRSDAEAVHHVNSVAARTERAIGTRAPWLQRPWITYGCAVAARPSTATDMADIQQRAFSQTNRLRHASATGK